MRRSWVAALMDGWKPADAYWHLIANKGSGYTACGIGPAKAFSDWMGVEPPPEKRCKKCIAVITIQKLTGGRAYIIGKKGKRLYLDFPNPASGG